ncbi:MAG: transcription-repair coupling factor, partial [Endomicrobiales bacterium]
MMKKYYSGIAGSGRAYFVLEQYRQGGTFVVVTGEDEVSSWRDNLKALGQFFEAPEVYTFPQSDHFERLSTLKSIAGDGRGIIITTPESLVTKTVSPANLQKDTLMLEPGRNYEFNALIDTLSKLGYQRVDFVEEKGQFSRRGEVLDLWPPDQNLPWRLVFAINTLESLRAFDVVTQRSEEFLKASRLLPVREESQEFLAEYLPKDTLFYFDSPPEESVPEAYGGYDWLVNDALQPGAENAGFNGFVRWGGNSPLFISELARFSVQGYKTIIFCSNTGEKERIEDILFDNRKEELTPELLIGPLTEGFYSPSRKLAVFSSQEILYKKRPLSFPKFKTGRRLEGLWEISSGDYVVHERYGIGRYLGLKKLVRGEQEAEYLCLEYKGGDKLYVPVDDFRVVQKYVGVEGRRPRLYSLDTASWERAKQRAQKGAQDMAEELLKLYAARKNAPGHAYPPDNHWERELGDSFPFQETQDQLRAIEEVKIDLEQPRPMERLICGDVGYGKTEVAIRAAFKIVQDSKQVAVLVPTTVLSEQHFRTFSDRLAPFPVRLAVLSRFQPKKEQNKIVAAVNQGLIDITIGTHRLLSKDIKFRDLGLLIIDEEHRFGVKQKEKIKAFKKNVDVLLLSATPIPRTLSLALSNLRDLSVIESPPYGRLPIETHLGPYEENTVKKIIRAELSRAGQVFYVHNRVETIVSRAEYLKRLIPEIRWGVVHGQMPPAEVEKTMWRFLHRQLDVLVATTIIESGLDIPTVNTMIIEEAENFGLAQLYQLRGRIGRERQKAYCYLFFTPASLTDESRKRLQALQEFSELGSGFRLALRDLEIRGAGNILSARQHGFVKEIGFELYSRLLDEASNRLKGRVRAPEEWKTSLDISMPAYLPDDYVTAEDLRIIFYRRLAGARSENDLGAIRDELKDRFGSLPLPAKNLLELSGLRLLAEKLKIKSIVEEDGAMALYFSDNIIFRPEDILSLATDYAGILEFMRGESQGVRLRKEAMEKPSF